MSIEASASVGRVCRDVAILQQQCVSLLGPGGETVSPFNGSQWLRVDFGSDFYTADVASADAGDGTILTAVNNRVTVGKMTPAGTFG